MAVNQKLQMLRKLDFDDFCILTLMSDGHTNKDIAKWLYLTPPAISHRSLKYISIWGDSFFDQTTEFSKKKPSESGIAVCKKMKATLYIYLELPDDFRFVSLYE